MNKDYVIVVDSCSDLSEELRNEYNIEYVKMGFVKKINNKEIEIPASLDWDLYTNKELFDWEREGIELKTTQVPMIEFINKFTDILKQEKDILYIACSSALSGSYNLSLNVKNELLNKYPASRIECIDSLNSCLGQGLMAIDSAIMKQNGASIDEVIDYLEENKLCYNQIATVESLEYLKKAGRVKSSAAFFGNIFKVKPLIISDAKGQNYAIKKVRGRKQSLEEMVNMAKELFLDCDKQTLYIVHADCLDDAIKLKEMLIKELNPKEIRIELMGPIIGISTGPGTIGLFGKGKKVTIVGE